MSYDIYFRCGSCHADAADDAPHMGPTYNLTPIFDFALTGEDMPNPEVGEGAVVLLRAKTDRPRGLRLLDGKTGAESLPLLVAARARLRDADLAKRFLALEPKNGWGTLEDACEVIGAMLKLADAHPANLWAIH